MSGWRGSASFNYPIERMISGLTGKLFLVGDVLDETSLYGYEEIILEVSGKGYYLPEKISGPPENCYPEEGNLEWTVEGPDDRSWELELTISEREDIEEKLVEILSHKE
jgi:hypothetical protein